MCQVPGTRQVCFPVATVKLRTTYMSYEVPIFYIEEAKLREVTGLWGQQSRGSSPLPDRVASGVSAHTAAWYCHERKTNSKLWSILRLI